MRANVVVVVAPVSEDDARFAQSVEHFAVEALDPEAAVETLGITILPGAARINVDRFDIVFTQPVLNRSGDELRSVVASDELGRSIQRDRFLEQPEHIGRLNGTVRMNAVALASVFVNQVEDTKLPTSLGEVC